MRFGSEKRNNDRHVECPGDGKKLLILFPPHLRAYVTVSFEAARQPGPLQKDDVPKKSMGLAATLSPR